MKNNLWQIVRRMTFLLLSLLSLSCQKKHEVRGVVIEYGQTASPSFDDLELLVPGGERKSLRFLVSGNRLKWAFDDLNSDGKPDLTISSKINKTYFAKFVIQDNEPRIQLLSNRGITVTEIPPAPSKK
jgi:hypothetical protein